ncbi:MAG: SdpI family protein [Hyphomicrobiales bacterium]
MNEPRTSWRTEWPHWLLLAAMFALAAINWSTAPARIPVHWDAAGEVDRYGGRFEGILLMPLLAVVIYLLFRFLPRLDPGRANYASFAGAFATLRLAVLGVLAAIYGVMLLAMRGHRVDMATVVPFLIGLLFLVIGSVLGKLRPNWFFGIRTPWTLSSKEAWVKTHRLGGWVYIGIGVLLLLVGVIRREWSVYAIIFGAGGGTLWVLVYSYLVWRRDPNRVPPAGTSPADDTV